MAQVHLVDRFAAEHLLIIRSAVYHAMAELPNSTWKKNFMANSELQVRKSKSDYSKNVRDFLESELF